MPTSCSSRLGYGEAATASRARRQHRDGWCGRSDASGSSGPGSLPAGHQGLVRTWFGAAAAAAQPVGGLRRPRWCLLPGRAPTMLGQEALPRSLRGDAVLQFLRKHAGLWVWQQAEPQVPTGLLSSRRLLEWENDRCFPVMPSRNPRKMTGPAGRSLWTHSWGQGVGARYPRCPEHPLWDLGLQRHSRPPQSLPLDVCPGPSSEALWSSRFQANS